MLIDHVLLFGRVFFQVEKLELLDFGVSQLFFDHHVACKILTVSMKFPLTAAQRQCSVIAVVLLALYFRQAQLTLQRSFKMSIALLLAETA